MTLFIHLPFGALHLLTLILISSGFRAALRHSDTQRVRSGQFCSNKGTKPPNHPIPTKAKTKQEAVRGETFRAQSSGGQRLAEPSPGSPATPLVGSTHGCQQAARLAGSMALPQKPPRSSAGGFLLFLPLLAGTLMVKLGLKIPCRAARGREASLGLTSSGKNMPWGSPLGFGNPLQPAGPGLAGSSHAPSIPSHQNPTPAAPHWELQHNTLASPAGATQFNHKHPCTAFCNPTTNKPCNTLERQ